MYLGWFDPNKKTPVAMKVLEAARRYEAKVGRPATHCLANAEAVRLLKEVDLSGLELEVNRIVPENTFYVGESDAEPEEEDRMVMDKRSVEAAEGTLKRDGEEPTDYVLTGKTAWISLGGLSLMVQYEDMDVTVELHRKGHEAEGKAIVAVLVDELESMTRVTAGQDKTELRFIDKL